MAAGTGLGVAPKAGGGWRPQGQPRSDLTADLEYVGPFLFCDATDGQLEGSVQLAGPGQGSIAAEAAVSKSHSTSMNVCRLLVDSKTLESLHRDR